MGELRFLTVTLVVWNIYFLFFTGPHLWAVFPPFAIRWTGDIRCVMNVRYLTPYVLLMYNVFQSPGPP